MPRRFSSLIASILLDASKTNIPPTLPRSPPSTSSSLLIHVLAQREQFSEEKQYSEKITLVAKLAQAFRASIQDLAWTVSKSTLHP